MAEKEPQTVAGRELAERAAARKAKADGKRKKVWCAFAKLPNQPSDFVLFGTELAALRYAAEHGMNCKPVDYGVPLSEQIA